MKSPLATTLLTAAVSLLPLAPPADAQPLGTFSWQLQPYCNVLTLTVVQIGDRYTLDGTDDRCGAQERASVSGLAFLNPNGSIGFGLTLIGADGRSTHLGALISAVTLSGTWVDSLGQEGSYLFNPATPAGSPRPTNTSIRITAGQQNWFPIFDSDPMTFMRHRDRLYINRPLVGAALVTMSPHLPVLENGRRLRMNGVEICYAASATAVLSAVLVTTTTHITDTSNYTARLNDTTDRSDEACRYFPLPERYTLGSFDAVNLVLTLNFTVANAQFRLGRTTFVFEPTFGNVLSIVDEPPAAATELTAGGVTAKEPPR